MLSSSLARSPERNRRGDDGAVPVGSQRGEYLLVQGVAERARRTVHQLLPIRRTLLRSRTVEVLTVRIEPGEVGAISVPD